MARLPTLTPYHKREYEKDQSMSIKQRSYFSRIERQVKFTYNDIDCNNHDKDNINLNKQKLR